MVGEVPKGAPPATAWRLPGVVCGAGSLRADTKLPQRRLTDREAILGCPWVSK
jgi:hypothetical protein